MEGFVCVVLHAHLPFVRHPEHEVALEESWLFEAITETYIPLLQVLQGWQRQGMHAPLTLTLSPTLCAMLRDPLLCRRHQGHLAQLTELAEKEIHRTTWEKPFHELARFYRQRLSAINDSLAGWGGDLVAAFRALQDQGAIEIITTAATHAVLPLLADHPPSLRAQVLVARDEYRTCFGRNPRGIWLPECAYVEGLESVLKEAGIQWFITDAHGVLHARPRPRYGVFAPVLTPNGIAVFGRDLASAKQVWSRYEGYPGDPRYRDFYRDIGFDLDLDYLKPYLPARERRSFTGLKYYRITGAGNGGKQVYDRKAALQAADSHADHFLRARREQVRQLVPVLKQPPVILAPYDAELFGHWWYEGPEFLDLFVRKAYYDQKDFRLATPERFLEVHPTHQVATPAASSWGEEGYWRVWLNEANQWIYPHLQVAQERLTELACRDRGSAGASSNPKKACIRRRALKQAARELMLAQASDWPFILRAGTSPEYARTRVTEHLLRFTGLYEQLMADAVDPASLHQLELADNLFPDIEPDYWAARVE